MNDFASSETKSITAENTFTNWARLIGSRATVTVAGSGTGTVVIQRRHVDPKTDTSSSNITEQMVGGVGVYSIEDYGSCEYRAGIKTGGYTSGTIEVSLEVVA